MKIGFPQGWNGVSTVVWSATVIVTMRVITFLLDSFITPMIDKALS